MADVPDGGIGDVWPAGFFAKFAGAEISDPRPRERYVNEAKRLLAVLDGQLAQGDWVAGDYSIADIAIAPWLGALDFYGAKDLVGWDDFAHLQGYVDRFSHDPPCRRVVLRLPAHSAHRMCRRD